MAHPMVDQRRSWKGSPWQLDGSTIIEKEATTAEIEAVEKEHNGLVFVVPDAETFRTLRKPKECLMVEVKLNILLAANTGIALTPTNDPCWQWPLLLPAATDEHHAVRKLYCHALKPELTSLEEYEDACHIVYTALKTKFGVDVLSPMVEPESCSEQEETVAAVIAPKINPPEPATIAAFTLEWQRLRVTTITSVYLHGVHRRYGGFLLVANEAGRLPERLPAFQTDTVLPAQVVWCTDTAYGAESPSCSVFSPLGKHASVLYDAIARYLADPSRTLSSCFSGAAAQEALTAFRAALEALHPMPPEV
jgi:hypothetical protein